jgi:hypothetical protein
LTSDPVIYSDSFRNVRGLSMNLWGIMPLAVAVLLSGGMRTHEASVHTVTYRVVAYSAMRAATPEAATPSPSSSAAQTGPSLDTTSATLTQVAANLWTTTVLLDDASSSCPGLKTDYWLETTSPNLAIPASAVTAVGTNLRTEASGADIGTTPCRVTVSFNDLTRVPVSAALVFDQAGVLSSTDLSLSRRITSNEYLTIPLLVGAGMVLLLLFATVRFVKVYDPEGKRITPDSWKFWTYTMSGSETWKVSIISVVTILAAFLSGAAFASSIFPGVGLAPFAVVSAIGGFVAAASTAVFGLLYRLWTIGNPAIGTDDNLWLQLQAPLQACTAELKEGTLVRLPDNRRRRLSNGIGARLQEGTSVVFTDDAAMSLAEAIETSLEVDTWITVPAGSLVELENGPTTLSRPIAVQLAAKTAIRLPTGTKLRPLAIGKASLPDAPTVELINEAKAVLAQDRSAKLKAGTSIRMPVHVVLAFPPETLLNLANRQATLTSKAGATTSAAADGVTAGTAVSVPAKAEIILGQDAMIKMSDVGHSSTFRVVAPSGAAITVTGNTIIETQGNRGENGRQKAQIAAGRTLRIPSGSRIDVLSAREIALSGGSDIIVGKECYLTITNDGGALTVAESDLLPDVAIGKTANGEVAISKAAGGEPPGSDLTLGFPIDLTTQVGAKITVDGAANITAAEGVAVNRLRQKNFLVRHERSIRLPQTSEGLPANMFLVVVPTVLTMLGIGIEIGVVGVLAVGLSDARWVFRSVMVELLFGIAAFTLYYVVTSIRTGADSSV